MPPEKDDQPSSISVQTLLISSVAAVAAAVIVPTFWERGSLLATAVTPIVVALVSEALNRPAKVIKTTTSQRVARRTATGVAVRSEQSADLGARGDGPERVSRWGDVDDPFGLRTTPRTRRRFPWKLALGTGLLAAVIGAAVVTASELAIFGHSVGHSDRTTSVFGGRQKQQPATPTATATPSAAATETATATEQATETPTAEATESATVTPSATATVSPETQLATPVPTEATPAPTP